MTPPVASPIRFDSSPRAKATLPSQVKFLSPFDIV
jgi:hypothetical protein